jgi:hypothetical protein
MGRWRPRWFPAVAVFPCQIGNGWMSLFVSMTLACGSNRELVTIKAYPGARVGPNQLATLEIGRVEAVRDVTGQTLPIGPLPDGAYDYRIELSPGQYTIVTPGELLCSNRTTTVRTKDTEPLMAFTVSLHAGRRYVRRFQSDGDLLEYDDFCDAILEFRYYLGAFSVVLVDVETGRPIGEGIALDPVEWNLRARIAERR